MKIFNKSKGIYTETNTNQKKSTKALRFGGYSMLITTIVIIAVIAVNIIASVLETNGGWKLDLTKNKVYTLDKLTVQTLQDIKEDIVIYSFQPAGSEEPLITNLLDMYAAKSDHITIKQIDPVKNPAQLTRFSTDTKAVGEYSVVVARAANETEKFYAITKSEMTETNDTSGSTYFILQQRLTSALLYINTNILQNVYFLSGHGEEVTTSAADTLFNRVEMENYNVSTLDLRMGTTTLKKGDILVVLNPTSDLSDEERQTILDFLQEHGKAVFFFNPTTGEGQEELTNFYSVLEYYLIKINTDIIQENDATRYSATGGQFYIRPALTLHDITSPIRENGDSIYMNETSSITYEGKQNDYYSFDKLLTTSSLSNSIPMEEYLNEEYKDKTYAENSYTVGAAYTEIDVNTAVTDNETRIVVFGSADVALGDSASNLGNMNLIRNSVNWVAGKEDQLFIAGVDITTDQLNITSYSTVITMLIILIVGIPLVLLGVGIFVWIRRKNL